MKLIEANNEKIKTEALKKGYIFTDEDCDHLRSESFNDESLNDAIEDYLNAYER